MTNTCMIAGKSTVFSYQITVLCSFACASGFDMTRTFGYALTFMSSYLIAMATFRLIKDRLVSLIVSPIPHIISFAIVVPWILSCASEQAATSAFAFAEAAALGLSYSLCKVTWGTLWGLFYRVEGYHERFLFQIGGGCIVSIGGLLIMPAGESLINLLPVGLFLSAGTSLGLGCWLIRASTEELKAVSYKESAANEIPRTSIWLRSYCIGFTIACSYCAVIDLVDFSLFEFFFSLLMGTLIGQGCLFVYSSLKKVVPNLISIDALTFAILEISILAGPITSLIPIQVSSILIFAALMTHIATYSYAVYISSDKNHISPLFHYSKRYHRVVIGITLGLGVCLLIDISNAQCHTLMISALALTSLIISNSGSTMISSDWDNLYRYTNQIAAENPETGETSSKGLLFNDVCAHIAKSKQLTARELDVLMLLAKGRNADSIGQLLYITRNTARSHIYRIYKKLDIGSQQDLIDYVSAQCEARKRTMKK